jgi:hypothetical protein
MGESKDRLDTSDMRDDHTLNRWQALKAVTPFLLLGLADLVLLLEWGLNPLWGFMILPPILFISVLGWIAFRTGFTQDRGQSSVEE